MIAIAPEKSASSPFGKFTFYFIYFLVNFFCFQQELIAKKKKKKPLSF